MLSNKITEDLRAEVIAHWIATGSMQRTSREMDVSAYHVRAIVLDAMRDPEMAETLRAAQAAYLIEAVEARQRLLHHAIERVENGAAVMADKTTDWARVIIECERSAHHLAKMTIGTNVDARPTDVTIIVSGPSAPALPEAVETSGAEV